MKRHIHVLRTTLYMILVFFLSFHNSKLWFRVGSFSELSFIFLSYNSKSIIYVLIHIIIMSEVLEHMFYSIKMANRSPFRCPKILFGPFRWLKSFSVFSRTELIILIENQELTNFGKH